MIITVTPNPLLNYVLDSFEEKSGETRCDKISAVAGGKGINVARMLKQMGQPALAMSFSGGANGEKLRQILAQESICMRWVNTAAETRMGVDLMGKSGMHAWWLENGGELEDDEIESLLHEIAKELPKTSYLALSGTVPGRKNRDFYQRILQLCKNFTGEIFVDAHGDSLKNACSVGGFFLKHNREEAVASFGLDPLKRDELVKLIEFWKDSRIWGAMVTDGSNDVILWDGKQIFTLIPAPIKQVSAIGCGDATLAGMIYGRSRGMTLIQSALLGLAAGAADAECSQPCSADFSSVQQKLFLIKVRSVESF